MHLRLPLRIVYLVLLCPLPSSTFAVLPNESLRSVDKLKAMERDGEGDVDDSSKPKAEEPPLALPPTNPNGGSGGAEESRTLRVGESLDFEELGPIIINSDGTTRRIANWDDMTAQEQQVTWKRIAARNKRRLEELKSRAEGGSGEAVDPP